jgi:two-component system response regulator
MIGAAVAPFLAGDQVHLCENGPAALDYLFCRGAHATRSPAEQPLLVLLDLRLPGPHGLDVLREIRANERTRLIPVIIFSASDDPADVRSAAALGANSFIRKAQDAVGFSTQVQQILRYWLELNLSPPVPTP